MLGSTRSKTSLERFQCLDLSNTAPLKQGGVHPVIPSPVTHCHSVLGHENFSKCVHSSISTSYANILRRRCFQEEFEDVCLPNVGNISFCKNASFVGRFCQQLICCIGNTLCGRAEDDTRKYFKMQSPSAYPLYIRTSSSVCKTWWKRRKNEKGTRWSAHLLHATPDPQEHIGPNIFLKYHAKYRFWPDLSMVKNQFRIK